jgi:hypothetical protein
LRRSALLILLAVITVAVAVPASVAGAAAPDAQTAAKAKKKTGKKKAAKCKTAKKQGKAKGKKKAGKSLADSAAKKKAKKKAAKCKAKPKKKAKAKPRAPAGPKGPVSPPPTPPPGAVLGDGGYKDSGTGLNVIVRDGGQTAEVSFVVPADDGCPGIGALIGSTKPFTRSATQAKASDTVSIPGLGVQVTWNLTVQLPSLTYVLQLDSQYSMPVECASQTTRQGTLVKQ